MNIKKIIAGTLACMAVFGAAPCFKNVMPDFTITASAAEEYTEGTYENFTYKKYISYIEISSCNTSAASVVIPAEIDGLPVTSIGDFSFWRCSDLTSVTIPDSVTIIGNGAFYSCSGLMSATIPDSVTSIGEGAFYDCTSLMSITISDSVTSIGYEAFYNCSSLTEINVSDKNEYYSSENGVLFNKNKTEIIQYPKGKTEKQYTIPNGVVSIGEGTFSYCLNLTSAIIPNSVKNIGNHAFYNCSKLTGITIPNSVSSIGNYAFYGCSDLMEITIPDSVSNIGNYSFSDCSGLKYITIENPDCEIADDKYTISDTATIYCYESSTAHAYAKKYNREFVFLGKIPTATILGDANGDSEVSIADVITISAYVGDAEKNPLSKQNILNGDVHNTGDGLTANDALSIQQYLAGIISEF